jgi:FtsP/CotA-like multicopper oxidase with cupredoxin domain
MDKLKIVLISFALSISVLAFAKNIDLIVTIKKININGKEVTVNTVVQPDGTWGYYGTEGDEFDVTVKNELKHPTILHWHGMLLPNNQDGTELTQPLIQPGKSYHYRYKIKQSGTYWMHSHYGFQEQTYVEAPLIIYPKGYDPKNDIVIMFQDFSFKSPEKIMKFLKNNPMSEHDMKMEMGNMKHTDTKTDEPDLNDVNYDAFLTNYHTLQNPISQRVIPGETYRLRFINGSSATNFWINLGSLDGTAIAVDGNKIKPFKNNLFQLAIAQRMDIGITIPKKGGVFPILGQVEGEKYQTGLILYTGNNINIEIPEIQSSKSPAFNYQQTLKEHADSSDLINIKPSDIVNIRLSGDMNNYIWQINGQSWPDVTPINLTKGKAYTLKITNDTGMSHPIHIHGHVVKIIAINDKPIMNGAIRDTVYVAAKSSITVVMEADISGKWFIHCHMLYHMHSGMMTFIETK